MRTLNDETRSSQPQRCSVRCHQRIDLRGESHGKSAETADAPALFLRASRAIDPHNFSGERPVFCPNHEASANRILEYVVPFRGVALVAAQKVIVEAWLPIGRQLLPRHTPALSTGSGKHSVQMSLQSFDPGAQRDIASRSEADKEVHVVGHDNVTADTDAELFGPVAVIGERVMQCGVGKDRLTPMRIERNEVNRRVEALEDHVETRGLVFDRSPHGRCCSVRCPQGTSFGAQRDVTNSAETADATTSSAEDSGHYSASQPDRAFRSFA
jgi:hypothetical protein